VEIPNKETMDEWYDHPVTAYFQGVIEARIQLAADSKTQVYYEGEPFKTQEHIARLGGALDELTDIRADIDEQTIENLEPELDDE
jgi:hypothetical protein